MDENNDEASSKTTPLKAAILGASEEYDADIYLYSGEVGNKGLGLITTAISMHKIRPNALLFLTTDGGLANTAYQIARIFQNTYEEFIIYCPSVCKSAGTLLALGADKLIMDMFSELGPLDVQLYKQDEIGSRKSGLLSKSALEALRESAPELYEYLMVSITAKSGGTIRFKLASEISSSITSNLLSPIYAQLDHNVVGGEYRDLDVAFHYGIRLIEHSKNAAPTTVYHIVHHYPAHYFIIDNEEAADLFHNVEAPSEHLYTIAGYMGDVTYDEADPVVAYALTPGKSKEEEGNDEQSSEGKITPTDGPDGGDKSVDESGETDRKGNRKPAVTSGGSARDDPAGSQAAASRKAS
jgi:hypothetical protein